MVQRRAPTSGRVAELRRCVDRCALFRGLSFAARQELAIGATEYWARRKEAFFHQGERARLVGLLCAGSVRMFQIGPGGQEVIVRVVAPGEMFGGLGAPPGGLNPATAEALEATHALLWERSSIEHLVSTHPEVSRNVVRVMAERIRDLEDRYRELATEPVAQRVALALLRLIGQPGRRNLELALSREELAQMTGTTLFTVSRLLRSWQTQGILVGRRGGVSIRDPQGLLSISRSRS
jgi:CRP-like cAMP-binding protein